MPASELIEEVRRGRTELCVRGAFDGAAAWSLATKLRALRGEVTVDFGHAGACNDYALLVLAQALGERGRPALVVGLNHHQLVLLRYLGLDISADGAVRPPPLLRSA
jgi:hypothetical protein